MIFASNNKGKLEEIRKIFSDYDIKSLSESNIDIDVVEDAEDFLGNATKKAKEIYNISKEEVIADDSGLCINALGGFPGVNTHRFLGEDKTDRERNEYLINEVNRFDDRSARVICYLVYYNGTDTIIGKGELTGYISKEVRGSNGFGFDEIFELENGKTLAQLSAEEKNSISARKLAAEDLKLKLKKVNI